MITHLQMISIFVKDLKVSVPFYRDKLGFVQTGEYNDHDGTHLIWLRPPETVGNDRSTAIALCEVPASDPRIGAVSGVVFTSDNIEATYQELKDRGVPFTLELMRHPYGEGEGDQEANFVDPDGNLFLLHT